jgi:hypothetical protein
MAMDVSSERMVNERLPSMSVVSTIKISDDG